MCAQSLPCGHRCCGIAGEFPCLPCLYCKPTASSGGGARVKQSAEDMCMICFEDRLEVHACIQNSACMHVFHLHCMRRVLQSRWTGPRISFAFLCCPICKTNISANPALADLLQPCRDLYDAVVQKALTRLEYCRNSNLSPLTNCFGLWPIHTHHHTHIVDWACS